MDKTYFGDRRETVRTQSEIITTPRGHRTGSVRFPIKVCGYPTISIRSPYGSDSKHQRKPEQEIVELLTHTS